MRAVFLDRDGVLNLVVHREGRAESPRAFTEFRLVPEVGRMVDSLKEAGFLVIVVTNQPDISRGLLKPQALERMHAWLRRNAAVDDILVCPHDDHHACSCRKPLPGMLLRAAERYDLLLHDCYLVGDSWKDMAAAKEAEVPSILIDSDYNQEATCDLRVKSLEKAISSILQQGDRRSWPFF